MMRRIFILFSLVVLSLSELKAQYPSEWENYTTPGYLYDIQSEKKDAYVSDTKLVNDLLGIARTNLAKQIQIKIEDNASIQKVSVNGRSNVNYYSTTC